MQSFQETHQQLADRVGLHVVELRREREYFPVLKASPSSGKVKEEQYSNEMEDIEMDYTRLYSGGRTEYRKPPKKPKFWKNPGYIRKLGELHKRRGQMHAQVLRKADLW